MAKRAASKSASRSTSGKSAAIEAGSPPIYKDWLDQELPPWLEDPLQHLLGRHSDGRMPHAVMLQGNPGVGKRLFAINAARLMLCSVAMQSAESGKVTSEVCGECSGCQLFITGNHPDFRYLRPVDDSPSIGVDEVRDLIGWLQLTGHFEGYKVALIDTADLLTLSAANSLLKTLEEPASNTLLFLIAAKPLALPATVASRCQPIRLQSDSREQTLAWLTAQGIEDPDTALRIAGNAPLLALQSFSPEAQLQRTQLFDTFSNIVLGKASIAKSVEQAANMSATECLQQMLSWTTDILKCESGASVVCRNSDLTERLKVLEPLLKTEQWFTIYDQLLELHRIDSASFKTQPVLESIFAAIRLERTS